MDFEEGKSVRLLVRITSGWKGDKEMGAVNCTRNRMGENSLWNDKVGRQGEGSVTMPGWASCSGSHTILVL